MAFDGIVTKALVAELSNNIIGGKIDKVFQPSKYEIILGVYNNKKNYALYLSCHPVTGRLHLTTTARANPISAPNFCMLLRKHILSGRILSISSIDLDRIVEIEIEGYNELNDLIRKKLVIEVMGKHSNIILLNPNNVIIDSIKHVDNSINSYREVLPARPYILPKRERKSFLDTDFDMFVNLVNLNKSALLDKTIADLFLGFSRPFVQNQINAQCPTQNLPPQKIYDNINRIISNISSNMLDFKVINDGKDYVINIAAEPKENLYLNFWIDDFYSQKELSDDFTNYRNALLKIILDNLKKFAKRLENINSKLQESKDYEKHKIYGELIIANLYKLDAGVDNITVENYYDNNNLITIPLDKTIPPSKNAAKYFAKYNKLKNTVSIVNLQKIETENELNYLESLIYSIESSKSISELISINDEIIENVLHKKSNPYAGPKSKNKTITKDLPLQFNINDFVVLVGKNNKQNDKLTFKLAKSNDIWFHTSKIHGSHVILKTEGREVDSDTLIKCAMLAAEHSKAKHSSSVPVDYTLVKNVKKPNGAKPRYGSIHKPKNIECKCLTNCVFNYIFI